MFYSVTGKYPFQWFATLLLVSICICNCKKGSSVDPANPSPEKSPQEELQTFQTEPDLEIKLVASEPLVEDPVISLFDEQNRMWVVEMRGFMNDIDRGGEDKKIGRISILEDTDGDEVMDKKTVYADSLIMPRAVGLFNHGALICENKALWETRDTNGDWIADTKIILDTLYAKNGVPEHSDNGLWRGIDNWYYNAKSTFKYKIIHDHWIKDTTEFRGQWGISHDDEGRLFYNYNWSQLHCDLVPPNYFLNNPFFKPSTGIDHGVTLDRKVFPIRSTPAVNRGYVPGTLNKDSMLIEFTAACSPYIYREKLLPASYYGNAFVCEPSGNLVKRNIVENDGILVSAHDPHVGREFMASTDERFRPVHIHTGPDGAIYITDMYRGLIQHGAYITPYLRNKTIERNLVLPVHCGRIWKLVPKNNHPLASKKLSDDSIDELINAFSDSSGWKRDLAQRLLVEKNDPGSIAKLQSYIDQSKSSLGTMHALWTLEGMGKSDTRQLIRLLENNDDRIFNTCLRLLEGPCIKSSEIKARVSKIILTKSVQTEIRKALQISLSSYCLESKASVEVLHSILNQYNSSPLIRDAVLSSLAGKEYMLLKILSRDTLWKLSDVNKEITVESLSSIVYNRNVSGEMEAVIPMLTDTSLWISHSILAGFKVSGTSAPQLSRLNSIPVVTVQSKLAPVFQWPGHILKIKPSAGIDSLSANDRKLWSTGRQYFLNYCSGCHGTNGQGVPHMGPTLVQSEWVLGDKRRLALILLHGIEGAIEVNKKVYDKPEILPVMPSHSTLADEDISAILTYIRNEWGNAAGAMDRRTVGMTRILAQGRVQPWTAQDLNKYIETSSDISKKLR